MIIVFSGGLFGKWLEDCDALSLGHWLSTFRKVSAFISSVGQFMKTDSGALFLDCLTCEDGDTMVFRNVGDRSPNNRTTVEHVSTTAVRITNVTVIYLFNMMAVMRVVAVCFG